MAKLSIVGTPIGNMGDITIRALQVLGGSDVILCEDTRVTKKLLQEYNINKPTISYHAHSKISRIEDIISMLKEGKNLCLVSDAGTPAISDPGSELVRLIREKLSSEIISGEIKIEAIPGPSALTSALSVAGVPCADFVFLGFLPHKKGRETLFNEIAHSDRTVVFYESPHRIEKTLSSLVEHLSFEKKTDDKKSAKKKNKQVVVCRELTKIFEEVVSGSPEFVQEYFAKNQEKVRGEFVVIVS